MPNTDLFAVCPHDTARGIDKWALFNTFVNRRVGLHSKYNVYLDFAEFGADLAAGRFRWAYLNPAHFLEVKSRFGYEAVARPRERFDIAYIVEKAHGLNRASLRVVAGRRVAAVKGYLFFLAKHALSSLGITFEAVPAKSYAEVMKLVENGTADFGVTYNEHYDPLAASVRERFSILGKVNPGLSHVVAVHPGVELPAREALANLLLGAGEDADRRKVLKELGVQAFELVPEKPFDELREILRTTSW